MKVNRLFFAKSTDGRLRFDDPEEREKFLRRLLFLDGKDIQISLQPKKKKRSLKQLGYLWGAVYPTIADHTGHNPEELHEIFKAMFCKKVEVFNGKEVIVTGSTKPMSTGDMVEFMMNIQAEAASMGITLPDPAEWDKPTFF